MEWVSIITWAVGIIVTLMAGWMIRLQTTISKMKDHISDNEKAIAVNTAHDKQRSSQFVELTTMLKEMNEKLGIIQGEIAFFKGQQNSSQ